MSLSQMALMPQKRYMGLTQIDLIIQIYYFLLRFLRFLRETTNPLADTRTTVERVQIQHPRTKKIAVSVTDAAIQNQLFISKSLDKDFCWFHVVCLNDVHTVEVRCVDGGHAAVALGCSYCLTGCAVHHDGADCTCHGD